MAAENVTAAFSAFIEALPAGTLAGRSVLIADDCFPSLHFLLSELGKRIGFTLVTVRTRPGGLGVEEEDFLAAWDVRVALGVVTWVTSTASRRADLGTIIAHARAHGSLVAADITQAAGILPFDIEQFPVDFAASTCSTASAWPGTRDVSTTARRPICRILRPCRGCAGCKQPASRRSARITCCCVAG